jgi:hypothetical protein
MSLLSRIVGCFLGIWIVFYLTAYYLYMAPDAAAPAVPPGPGAEQSRKALEIADTPFAVHRSEEVHRHFTVTDVVVNGADPAVYVPAVLTNPFLTPTCEFLTKHAREVIKDKVTTGGADMDGVGVVIPARNEAKAWLLLTVDSVLKNSGNELRRVIVVDDHSTEPVDTWPEWATYVEAAEARFGDGTGGETKVLQVVRAPHRLGVAGAKAHGASLLAAPVTVVAFVDAHSVVSHDWLVPLVSALHKHPQAIVYPAIDVIDGTTGDLIQGENAVGAFDWAFNFRWEVLGGAADGQRAEARRRVPLATNDAQGHPTTENDLVASPAAPGIFAMTLVYYHYLGGMNALLYPWGQDR